MAALKDEIKTSGQQSLDNCQVIDQKVEDYEKLVRDQFESQMKALEEIKIQRIKAKVGLEKGNTRVLESIEEKSNSRLNSLTDINSKVDAFSAEISIEEKAGLKHIESIDVLNTEKTQQMMNLLNEMNTKNTSLPEETKNSIESRKEVLSKQMSETNKMIDDSIKMCDKQLSVKQSTLKAFEESLNREIEEQTALVSQIEQNIQEINGCVDEKTSEMIRMTQTMERSQIREIENRSKSFESFVRNDLTQDTPTGTTPQKTTYTYPRDLVATSPHQRILERFRLVNACNTPLPENEDTEQDSELLSSRSSSSSSLKSFSSNDENMKPLTDNEKRKKGLKSKFNPKSKVESKASDQTFSVETEPLRRTLTPRVLTNNRK